VDGRGCVDEFADGLEVVCAEDCGVAKVGDYEGVRRWCGQCVRWYGGEVDREWCS